MNTYIYIAPIRQESLEVLEAEEMTFDSMPMAYWGCMSWA